MMLQQPENIYIYKRLLSLTVKNGCSFFALIFSITYNTSVYIHFTLYKMKHESIYESKSNALILDFDIFLFMYKIKMEILYVTVEANFFFLIFYYSLYLHDCLKFGKFFTSQWPVLKNTLTLSRMCWKCKETCHTENPFCVNTRFLTSIYNMIDFMKMVCQGILTLQKLFIYIKITKDLLTELLCIRRLSPQTKQFFFSFS